MQLLIMIATAAKEKYILLLKRKLKKSNSPTMGPLNLSKLVLIDLQYLQPMGDFQGQTYIRLARLKIILN